MTLNKIPAELPDSFPDFPTPSQAARRSPSRRETILSLVEMLLQDSDGQRINIPNNPVSRTTETSLRNFANAARRLGSSVAIISSAYRLRERLAQILYLYQENAADLFPQKIAHISRESITEFRAPERRTRRGRRRRGKAPLHVLRPAVTEHLDLECFPEQLEALAREVTAFLDTLNEFLEFPDKAVNASILSFEGQFRYPAVQQIIQYIYDLTDEMGEHIDGITSSLCMFIDVGVPIICFLTSWNTTLSLMLSTLCGLHQWSLALQQLLIASWGSHGNKQCSALLPVSPLDSAVLLMLHIRTLDIHSTLWLEMAQ
ncbi:uncharacterized protein LACBIDRAFT_331253 [Laccaria bicolor S238N-H82]|uniref:Predicted protein n=1 Tax=Laccaria bicolor (strain S238N-H82 / ATCC MYA-4686) TaxID=486041 RepID=B0DNX9_LACBS|nr:uncharacterized protein LACBIDRAFT_331253 [Laccaria bicolor S238N-H82]EDR03728.1 predicted protein [Laccaria bicolor S238N-H82]|eukprot:XP_001885581.1 predicted protein [Laccaria bicolor S238N-H82]